MAQEQNIVHSQKKKKNKTLFPRPKEKGSFAISRGLIVIGVSKNGTKQKFGEIVSVFGEI